MLLRFWDLVKDPFMRSLEFSLQTGTLTDGQRLGVITLLPKKDLDKTLVSNWRPITLLNSDLKIISKALAKRLQSCVKDVVAEDQSGFIRGRSIINNLNNIQALVDHTNASGESGALLAVDYAKAFDTVRWELIFHALEIFGFGDFILRVVKMFFKDIKSCTYNAGFASDLIFPARGIRQGCCSSPTLFILVAELLAILVRKSLVIRGMDVAGKSFRVSQYADDSTFFVSDLESVSHLLRLLASFTKLSGLRINLQKSHLLLLGSHLHPPTSVEGIKVTDKVKILGVYFKNGITEEEQYLLNYRIPLAKIRIACQAWSNRSLSLKGKVTVINSLMISLLQYPMSCTPVPMRALVEYKKLVVDFLWSSKRSKIAYNLLVQNVNSGGLRLADLETRIRTAHISLIRASWFNTESIWVLALKTALGQDCLRTLLASKANWAKNLHPHYAMFREILKSWAQAHNFTPDTEEMVQREIIWNNNSILIAQKPVYWHRWSAAGIRTIADLLHTQEARFLFHEELSQRFGIPCSFLNVLQLRTAIPAKWKRLLVNPAPQNTIVDLYIRPTMEDYLKITSATSKKIYASLILCKMPTVSAQVKWAETFPDMDPTLGETWQPFYQVPYRAMRDTKYHAFQYKLLQRIIPCNKYLANIRIKQESTCSFCDEVDSIQHFLLECNNTKRFWARICGWLEQNDDLLVHLSQQEFLFGLHPSVPGSRKINFLTIFTKFFIHRQKLFHNGDLPMAQFLRELRTKLQMEKQICGLENKPNKFRCWTRILAALG